MNLHPNRRGAREEKMKMKIEMKMQMKMKMKIKMKMKMKMTMKMKMKMQVKVKVEMKMKMKIRKHLQDTTKILLRYLREVGSKASSSATPIDAHGTKSTICQIYRAASVPFSCHDYQTFPNCHL